MGGWIGIQDSVAVEYDFRTCLYFVNSVYKYYFVNVEEGGVIVVEERLSMCFICVSGFLLM